MTMPVFDMHADVLMDIVRNCSGVNAGCAGVHATAPGEAAAMPMLEERHLWRIRAGGIFGAVLIDCRMAGESAGPEHLEAFIATVKRELGTAVRAGDGTATATSASRRPGIRLVLGAGDLERAMSDGSFAAVVGYEGLKPSGGDLSWIRRLYDEAWMRLAMLTHNDDNPFGGGGTGLRGALPSGHPDALGLTELGREAVDLMNGLGILIDLSHAGRITRRDILEVSKRPVILSHTSARAVYDNGRNLSDDEMRAIADAGGLVGCMTSPAALAPLDDRAHHSLDRYMEHLLHMIGAAGIEHVGLGLHFCEYLYTREQYPLVAGLEDASRTQGIIEALRAAGLGEDAIEKIAWKNFARVFGEATGSAPS
jgi:membrane dipeptidase